MAHERWTSARWDQRHTPSANESAPLLLANSRKGNGFGTALVAGCRVACVLRRMAGYEARGSSVASSPSL